MAAVRRTFAIFVALIAIALLSGPRVATQTKELKDVKGTIRAVRPDAGWFAIVPDADRGTRYAPDRLSDDFKKDGLRVIFSGRVKPVDPAARSWGVPFELTDIRVE